MSTPRISTYQLFLLLVCNIIGAGVFIVQPQLFSKTSNDLATILCFVFSFFVVILFGLCYCELGCCYPFEGGDVVYLKLCYGKWVSLFYSLISVCLILPGGCSLMLGRIFSALNLSGVFYKSLFCLFFCFMNCFLGFSVFKVQYVLTCLKVSAMLMFAALAFLVFSGHVSLAENELVSDHSENTSLKNLLIQQNDTNERDIRTEESNMYTNPIESNGVGSAESINNYDRSYFENNSENPLDVLDTNQTRNTQNPTIFSNGNGQESNGGSLDLLITRTGGSFSLYTMFLEILAGSATVLWTYDGWNAGNFVAHTVRRPYPSFPIAICSAVAVVLFVYLLINLSFMYVLPISKRGSDEIVKEYFKRLSIPNIAREILGRAVGLLPSLGTFSGSFIVATSILDNHITNFIKKRREKASTINAIDKIETSTSNVSKNNLDTSNDQYNEHRVKRNKIGHEGNHLDIQKIHQNNYSYPVNEDLGEIQDSQSNDLDSKSNNRKIFWMKMGSMFIFSMIIVGFTQISPEKILEKLAFMIYVFYGLSIAGIFVLRNKDGDRIRPFRVHNSVIYICLGFTTALGLYNIYRTFHSLIS